MQTLPGRTRTVLVALLVVLSSAVAAPAVSAATTDTYAQQETDDEPNDTVENATTADTDRAINGEIGSDGDVDYYAIDLRENSQVEITQGIGAGALPVTLLDRNGEQVGRITDQEVFEGEEDLLRANTSYTGTYYLRVEGNPGEAYSIGVSVTMPDANEPNDDFESATAVESGERVVGTVVTGDRDVFAIDADAGEELGVIGNATAAAQVTIYGPDESALAAETLPSPGGVFESEQGYGTPVASTTATENGTYYVVVAIENGTIGNANGPYNLTVTTDSNDSASATGNETTADEDSNDTPDENATETASSEDSGMTDETADGNSDGDADGATSTTVAASATTSAGTSTETTTTAEETTADETDTTTTNESSSPETTDETENTTVRAGTGTEGTSTPTRTTTEGQNDVSENVEETAVNGPGFGLLAALIALFGAALLATRRN